MSNFKQLCTELENEIRISYETGVTIEEAERLAAKFLHAQFAVSAELKTTDLNARMLKSGVKAIRAAIYMNAATSAPGEKRPTEAALAATVDVNELVQGEQQNLDIAEVEKADLERYYDIFSNAHIFYRTVAKGNFNA